MSTASWPVSVKAVVLAGEAVLLLRNERHEWELPGGRLEPGEQPHDCARREVAEETGLAVEVEQLIDTWVYRVLPDREVLILTFGCRPLAHQPEVVVSAEHADIGFFPTETLHRLPMPEGYRTSIRRWVERRDPAG